MSTFELLTLVIAFLSFVGSLFAVYTSGKANNINKNIAKRQGVISLHMAWQDVSDIDVNNLITPDVVKAVNALSLTASLWNHDVVEREILHQSYWDAFSDLYDKLINCSVIPPKHYKTCRDMITVDVKRAYAEMKDFDIKKVKQTKI